jgi:outer membrane protein assembly factor BamB
MFVGADAWAGEEPAQVAPAVAAAGDTLYVAVASGLVTAYDLTQPQPLNPPPLAEPTWTPTPEFPVAMAWLPELTDAHLWTASIAELSSVPPVVAGDTVYAVGVGGRETATLAAFDAASGAERWRADVAAPTAYIDAPPAVGGGQVFLELRDGTLLAFLAASGRELWRIPGLRQGIEDPSSAPFVAGDTLFVARGLGSSSPLAVDDLVIVGGNRHLRLAAYEVLTGRLLWETPVADEPTYPTEDTGYWAFDAATGAVRWFAPTGAPRNLTPVHADGRIFAALDQGMPFRPDTYLIEIDAATGTVRPGQFGVPYELLAPPVAAGAQLFFRVRGGLLEFTVAEPRSLWDRQELGNSDDPPAVADGFVLVGSPDGSVYGLDAATGDPLWRIAVGVGDRQVWRDTPDPYLAPAVTAADGVLYVATVDGLLRPYALPARDDPATPPSTPAIPPPPPSPTATPPPPSTIAPTATPIAPPPTATPDAPCVGYAVAGWAFDPSDEAQLARFATDIFVGRVVAVTGHEGVPTSAPGMAIPATQYAVAVEQTIKGSADDTVVVSQLAGIDATSGCLMLFEGDWLLQPGETALFVTGYDPVSGWRWLVADGHSHPRIENEQQRSELVARYSIAVAGTPPATPEASPNLRAG